jgi:hypothetical protein
MRRPATIGAALVVAVFVLGVLVSYLPNLTQKRTVVASTPSLLGFTSSKEVLVRGGQQACISPVPLEPAIRRIQMVLRSRGPQATPLDIELRGPGYRGTGRFAGYAPRANATVQADVTPASPSDADGTLCLRNTGRRAVGLVGTDEPVSVSLPATAVDGKPAGEIDPAITFLDGPPASVLGRAGTVLGRASDFAGGVVPLWLLWPLTLLFVLGVPAALAYALYTEARRSP